MSRANLKPYKKSSKSTDLVDEITSISMPNTLLNNDIEEINEDFDQTILQKCNSQNIDEKIEAMRAVIDNFSSVANNCPIEFILNLLNDFTSKSTYIQELSFELLMLFCRSKRCISFLLANGLLQVIQQTFPREDTIKLCCNLVLNQDGRRELMNSHILNALNSLFTENITSNTIVSIAVFMSNCMQSNFIYPALNDEVFAVMNNLLPYVDKIHPPDFVQFITHAWNNFVWANDIFARYFIKNDLIDRFIEYCSAYISNNEAWDAISDTLMIIEGILLMDHKLLNYFMEHSMMNLVFDSFHNFDALHRASHYCLISLIISIDEELSDAFISNGFAEMIVEKADYDVRQILSSVTLAIDFLNNSYNNQEILIRLRDLGYYLMIVDNIELLGQKDFKYALNALLTISKLPHDDDYIKMLSNFADNNSLMDWIEELKDSESLEVGSLAQLLEEIIIFSQNNTNF